jgi:carboxyl-terminal processing protease
MSPAKSRLFAISAFVLLLFVFNNLSGEAQTRRAFAGTNSSLTLDERLDVFEDTWQTIYERYYDTNFNGVNWKTAHDRYRPLVEDATSNDEFYRQLKAMVSSLKDAHTRVFSPDEKSDWERPKYITVGLAIRKIDSKPVVVAVDRGSDAEKAGIRPGFIVASVDGKPVDDVLEQMRDLYSNSSTERSAELRIYSRIFSGKKGSTVTVNLLDGDGKLVTYSLKRFEEYSAPQLLYKRLDRDFGYITFNGFWPETAAEFERAIKILHDTRGLIIDLRENGGGAAFSAAQMASYLFPRQTSLGQFVSRTGSVTEPKTQPVDKLMYSGQVMVLISEQSGSGAEVFAATLQEQGRVSVIGHPSCGCVLGINRRHILPDGGALDVSEVDYHTSKGTRLEGVGVIPNTVTDLHISDLLSGRDTAMETALTKLRQIVYAGVSPPAGQ